MYKTEVGIFRNMGGSFPDTNFTFHARFSRKNQKTIILDAKIFLATVFVVVVVVLDFFVVFYYRILYWFYPNGEKVCKGD